MTPGEGRAAQVREIRNTLGLGLRQAHDAFLRYGSADAAIQALGTPAKRDAFETEYDRLRAENIALAASHQRLKEALQRVSFVLSATPDDPGEPSFMAEVREALRSAP